MPAGHFGVPQGRWRVFMWAAAPDQQLPALPGPTHNCVSFNVRLPGVVGVKAGLLPRCRGCPRCIAGTAVSGTQLRPCAAGAPRCWAGAPPCTPARAGLASLDPSSGPSGAAPAAPADAGQRQGAADDGGPHQRRADGRPTPAGEPPGGPPGARWRVHVRWWPAAPAALAGAAHVPLRLSRALGRSAAVVLLLCHRSCWATSSATCRRWTTTASTSACPTTPPRRPSRRWAGGRLPPAGLRCLRSGVLIEWACCWACYSWSENRLHLCPAPAPPPHGRPGCAASPSPGRRRAPTGWRRTTSTCGRTG